MLLQCLECNYKCGNIAVLKYHYESFHKDKTDICMCGNIILSGICANDFSPWGCSLKTESSSSSNSNSNSNSNSSSNPSSSSKPSSNSNSNSNSSSNPSSSSNPNSNSSSNPSSISNPSSSSSSNPNSSSISGSDSTYDYNSNSDPNPNPNPNLNLIPNPNPGSEVLTGCCNKCNYIKPLNNFDEGKYTCRSCTSTKVNCPYCTSVARYDWIRAHVKKQHPDIELTRGFSRNLQSRFPDITDRCNRFADKTFNPCWQSSRAVSPLVINQIEDLRSSFTDSCSCKYNNFVSFLINNGINIEKIKENINLLKSIDNLK